MGRPIRVMMDARMLMGRFSGVARFVTRLAEELVQGGGVEIVALCGDEPYEPWANVTNIEVVRTNFKRSMRTVPRRVLWEATKLSSVIAESGVDLFHATWNFGIPQRCPVPSVLTIHDLIPWSGEKEGRTPVSFILAYRHAVKNSAKRAARITTVSEAVRRQILAKLPAHEDKVVTVFNGADPMADEISALRQDPEYFALYVGGHEPRKNVAGVFRAMQAYWSQYDETLELRLTGTPEALSAEAAEVYIALPDDAPVRFLAEPIDDELAQQYASASLLLMLSHEEGFGLPVLEAMAHGCPVVAANQSSLPEVVGDAGLLVNPKHPGGVADTMHWLISDAQRLQEYATRGIRRAAGFSWNLAASRMHDVYKSVLSGENRDLSSERAKPQLSAPD